MLEYSIHSKGVSIFSKFILILLCILLKGKFSIITIKKSNHSKMKIKNLEEFE